MSPNGSEQVLSLVWALKQVAGFEADEAVRAVANLFGIAEENWQACVRDSSWYVGDPRWRAREQIAAGWNDRYARSTDVWLDEDVWHRPLWELWLRNEKMVFAANLEYLISLGGRGTVARLARFTGRTRSTVSKWARWKQKGEDVRVPPRTILARLLEFFELQPTLDLYREPLFLGRNELRDAMLRVQGRHYIESLTGDSLSHAIELLREESARYAVKRQKGDD